RGLGVSRPLSDASVGARGGDRLGTPGRLAAWLGLVGLLTVLNYASRYASGKPPKDVLYHYSQAVGGFVQYAIILGIVLSIAWVGPLREALALRRPRSLREAVLLSITVLVTVYAVAAILNPFLHPGREQGLTPDRWEPSRAGAFAVNFVLLAGIAP